MALEYTCDRCGKKLLNWNDVKRRFRHDTYYKARLIPDLLIDEIERGTLHRDIDLCQECNDSFIDWFNSGKKKTEQQEQQ